MLSNYFCLKRFNSNKNRAKYGQKCILVFKQSNRSSWSILTKLEFSQQTFQKCSNIKFHEDLSSGSLVVLYGRRDGRTDTTELMVAFRNCERA